jgi:hypothetical protein
MLQSKATGYYPDCCDRPEGFHHRFYSATLNAAGLSGIEQLNDCALVESQPDFTI